MPVQCPRFKEEIETKCYRAHRMCILDNPACAEVERDHKPTCLHLLMTQHAPFHVDMQMTEGKSSLVENFFSQSFRRTIDYTLALTDGIGWPWFLVLREPERNCVWVVIVDRSDWRTWKYPEQLAQTSVSSPSDPRPLSSRPVQLAQDARVVHCLVLKFRINLSEVETGRD